MKSVMKHNYAMQPSVSTPRSKLNRSHGYKTTFNAGLLIPIFWDEVLPGDTHSLNLNAFARLATPIKPIMDNLNMDFMFFFCPNRILYENWERLMGAQDNPGDSIDFLVPQVEYNNAGEHTIWDYLGYPIKNAVTTISVNALYARAYNKIWNAWMRDENLQDSVVEHKDDGPDPESSYAVLRRGKRQDYFTSVLPFPQKGTPVQLPLGQSAPVLRTDNAPNFWTLMEPGTNNSVAQPNAIEGALIGGKGTGIGTGMTTDWREDLQGDVPVAKINFDPNDGLFADLNAANGATINAFRQALQIQAMLERDARGGTRYTEKIKAFFGVTSPDARLQRPEYLGGGTIRVGIQPVEQNSRTASGSNLGDLAGYGVASGKAAGFRSSFTEHGVIIGMVSVRADLNYYQGIDREMSRLTQYDYFFPDLQNIGEQAVLNKEIYFDDITPSNNDNVFGYAERYNEYRTKLSKITGLFRGNATGTIDIWHLAQEFSATPVLNASFIEDNPPVPRIIAVPSEPQFLYDSVCNYISVRPMSMYAIPFNFSRL